MQQTRPAFRRHRRLRHHDAEEREPGYKAAPTACGLPLFLRGARRSQGHAFGAVVASSAPQPTAQLDSSVAEPEQLPVISGEGMTTQATAYGLALRGRTDASFSNDFSTEDGQTRPATGCTGCGGGECIRATGTLVSTFQVATTVTLPSVDDFPGLTPCQRDRVQNGITNVLAPHEQQHVAVFQTYNGTVRTPFNLKLCQDELDARIQSLHDGIAASRQARAQARSDALDPFNFDVDLNCQDKPAFSGTTTSPGQRSAGATSEDD